MLRKIRLFLVNIVCGFVWGRDRRRHVRTVLSANLGQQVRFIRRNLGTRISKIRVRTGFMGRNIVIIVNDAWAFKFPVRSENHDKKAINEKRIVDALRKYCPVHVPNVELLEMRTRGETSIVRKYECVPGKTVRDMPAQLVMDNIDKLAPQIARIVYEIARADPRALRDLKPTPNARPGYMRGWCQGDICDNFMIDTKRMKIIAYIDWEDARFLDFPFLFMYQYKNSPERELMAAAKREYDKIWENAAQ